MFKDEKTRKKRGKDIENTSCTHVNRFSLRSIEKE